MVSPLTRKLGRDAARSKAQFIAVAVTMFLGVTLFAASYDSYQNLQASYSATHTEFRFANLTIGGGDTDAAVHRAGRRDLAAATCPLRDLFELSRMRRSFLQAIR